MHVAAVVAVTVGVGGVSHPAWAQPPLPDVAADPDDAAQAAAQTRLQADPPDAGALAPTPRLAPQAEAPVAPEGPPAPQFADPEEAGTSADLQTARTAANTPPRPAPVDAPTLSVAIGLGPQTPGSDAERAIVEALEQSVPMSTQPRTELRRLRPGAEPRTVCAEGREDLVISVGYLPDRDDPVLLVHDCSLDVPLGVRASSAASNPDLVGVLWQEHEDLVAAGYKERRERRLNPKVRAGLIIGGAAIAIGLAVGLIVANALRDEVVVLKVSP